MSDAKVIGGEYIIKTPVLTEKNRICNPSFSLGRTCLYRILESLYGSSGKGKGAHCNEKEKSCQAGFRQVLFPDYLCSSVAEVPFRLGIPVRHYHICSDYYPDYDSIKGVISDGYESIVLISYFGLIDLDETIKKLRKDYPSLIIIIDDVQNFFGFGKHIDFDYCFSSYRKWFCVPDGADIIQKDRKLQICDYSQESKYVLYKAAGNLLKNHSGLIGDTVSLELISKGEAMMDGDYLYRCSNISKKLFNSIDIVDVQNKRKQNAAYLHRRLGYLGIKHAYNPNSTPLFIPISVPDREGLKELLFMHNIFVPVHWPVADSELQGENELYSVELSLICDQRYDEEDMERILTVIEYGI